MKFDSSQSTTFNTANGAVQKHIGVADTVKLGGLVASGVRVAVSQRGAPDYVPGRAVGLLGMSFLSLFDMHMGESELRLSSRPKGVPASAKADRLDQRPQVVAPSEPPAAVAAREWQDVKGSNSRAVLEAFRKRHEKDPVYSALADEAMRKLAPETLAVPVPVPARRATRDPALSVNAGSGASFRDCPECPEMVVVPAGSFMMGSPGSEARYVIEGRNERPQRHVTIAKPFAVGKFEVTFSEWEACVADFGCQGNRWPSDEGWSKGRRPVINVSWNDAKEYIAWLSRKTGQTYRLLTEAEWEYAARAGTTTRYSWGDEFSSSSANNNKGRTVPVGEYPANPWGLYDVHGNAWEWVEDCYGNYIGAPTDGTAAGGAGCSSRVLRGGSWFNDPRVLRSASRNENLLGSRGSDIGFRLARSIDTRDDSASSGVPASPQKGLVNGDVKAAAPADSKADMPAEANGPVTRETRGHSKESIVITVTRDGAVLLGVAEKIPITLDEIGTTLRAIANARGTDEPIFVRGANEAAYGHFAEVMARIQRAGFKRVSLVIDGHAPPPAVSHKKLTAEQASLLGTLMRRQVSRCWNINTGLEGIDNTVVKIEVRMKPDGTLAQPPKVVGGQNSPIFADAANSAVRALVRCEPYELPADLYQSGWDYMVVTFDPKRMF